MNEGVADPLLLGQRVVAILETGLRTATYKLATLMALIEHCIENLPDRPPDTLVVPLPDLARRVMGLYWRQVLPFDGNELRQSTQPRARIIVAINDLRRQMPSSRSGLSLDIAALRAPDAHQRAVNDVILCLAQQPLHRLQRLPGAATSDPFLYDDSFLHDQVSRTALRAHGDAIVLKPGVAHGLSRLAGLLKPALEIMWVEDVRRMNRFLDSEVPDVAGAEPTYPRTIRSTTCCHGRSSASTGSPTWSWRAPAATATRAAPCRPRRSSTGCSAANAS